MTTVGYARVSTIQQDLEIQLDQLKAAGCERLFFEKESGMKNQRRVFDSMLRRIRSGDVVIVPALDRLTRLGPFKMLSVLHEITERGATYRSLAEPWADTTHELGELHAAFIGYIARRTRDDIVRRTTDGRRKARERGVRFGRPPKLTIEQRELVLQMRAGGKPQCYIANAFQVSCSTISRIKAPCP